MAHAAQKLFRGKAIHLFLREVHGQADLSPQCFQASAHLAHPASQQAVQLRRAQAGRLTCGRGDHFGDSFGLRQIHASVAKGPARKFAPLRLPRAQGQRGPQQRLKHGRAAMAMNFSHIFAGERFGTGHEDRQNVIQRFARNVRHVPVVQRPGTKVRKPRRRGSKYTRQNGLGVPAGQAHDADAARAQGRRYGADGVVVPHSPVIHENGGLAPPGKSARRGISYPFLR